MWLCGNSTQNMFIASWQRSTSATVFSNQKPILRVPIGFLLVCILFGVLACLYSLLKNAWNWKRLLSKDLVFFTFTLNVRGVNGKSPLCPKKAAHCMHELVFNLSPVFNLNCPHCSMNHIESMISKKHFFIRCGFQLLDCFQRIGFSFYENWVLPCNKLIVV